MNENVLKKHYITSIKIIDELTYYVEFTDFGFYMSKSTLLGDKKLNEYILNLYKMYDRNKKLLKIRELTENKLNKQNGNK